MIKGSGMGLECSGDVNDVCFYELAEKDFVLKPEIIEKYCLEFYARFRDDIVVIIAGDAQPRLDFVHELKRHSRFYKLKVESISKTSCIMLDLVLSKGKRFDKFGVFDVGIHTKPSSQGTPLCNKSWHLPSIHRSWPDSRLIHYKNVCSDFIHFRDAAFGLFEKIRTYSPGHPGLESLAVGMTKGSLCGNGKHVQSSAASSSCSRLILPYHPCFSRLSVALARLEVSFTSLGIGFVRPVAVFSLGGRSIARCMQSDCRRKLLLHYKQQGSGR